MQSGENPIAVQIINNYQSQSSLQQTLLGKHQSEVANHRPGKPNTLSQHASTKLDMLSQHVKHRQAIPICIAKVIVYKGLQEPRTADKLMESEEPNTEDKQWTSRDTGIAVEVRKWHSNDNNILGS